MWSLPATPLEVPLRIDDQRFGGLQHCSMRHVSSDSYAALRAPAAREAEGEAQWDGGGVLA
jgi:hypothetical protein